MTNNNQLPLFNILINAATQCEFSSTRLYKRVAGAEGNADASIWDYVPSLQSLRGGLPSWKGAQSVVTDLLKEIGPYINRHPYISSAVLWACFAFAAAAAPVPFKGDTHANSELDPDSADQLTRLFEEATKQASTLLISYSRHRRDDEVEVFPDSCGGTNMTGSVALDCIVATQEQALLLVTNTTDFLTDIIQLIFTRKDELSHDLVASAENFAEAIDINMLSNSTFKLACQMTTQNWMDQNPGYTLTSILDFFQSCMANQIGFITDQVQPGFQGVVDSILFPNMVDLFSVIEGFVTTVQAAGVHTGAYLTVIQTLFDQQGVMLEQMNTQLTDQQNSRLELTNQFNDLLLAFQFSVFLLAIVTIMACVSHEDKSKGYASPKATSDKTRAALLNAKAK